MDESQFHSFKYDLRQLNKSLEKIIELLEVISKPTITPVEEITGPSPQPYYPPGGTVNTDKNNPTGNERPVPV